MASLGPGGTNANAAPVAAMPPATVQLVHVRCEVRTDASRARGSYRSRVTKSPQLWD